jgi:ParB-like chromosome segregation protein Spo0J
MEIENWKIDKVMGVFWADNPRSIADDELDRLRLSIREFGLVLPPIFNRKTDKLIGGHQRTLASKLEGLEEIPVLIVDYEESQATALALALNRIKGQWDYDLLTKAVEVLVEEDILELSGFDEAGLMGILESKMEDEIEDFSQDSTVTFECPDFSFSVVKSDYEVFVNSLSAKFRFDDFTVENEFFRLINL